MTSTDLLLEGPVVLVAIMTCVLTPLALRVVGLPRLSTAALATGALSAATSSIEPGTTSLVFVAPYALVCAIAGLVGVRRAFARWWPPSELAPAAALVVLAAASVWLVAYRANYALLEYVPLWVILTAGHFHVAGCYLAIVVGASARGRGALAQLIVLGCLAGLPLTAIGILVTGPIETVAAMVMATSGFGAAVMILVKERGLLRFSALPLLAGMVLAALYALRAFGTAVMIGNLDPLTSMIVSHAVLDTLFGVLALVALVTRPAGDDL